MTLAESSLKPFGRVLLVSVACLLVYSSTFLVPFILDDDPNIVLNSRISSVQSFFENSSLSDTRIVGAFSFMLNRSFNGLDVRGYHVVNLVIHLLNSLLVMGIIAITARSIFSGNDREPGPVSPAFAALWGGFFFALHPVQTQAVTYIVQRFSSLAALFCLLAFFAYLRFSASEGRARRALWYAVCLCSLIAGMKTKENTFTFPLIIAIYDLLFADSTLRTRAARLLPVLLTLPVVPLSLLGSSSSVGIILGSDPGTAQLEQIPGRMDYLATQGPVIATYLRLVLFPINQNLDYDYQVFSGPAAWPVLAWLLHAAIIGSCLVVASRSRALGKRGLLLACFGVFWFYIALSVESGVVPIRDVIFEHRLYLPLAGLSLAVSAGLLQVQQRLPSVRSSAAFALMLLTCIAALSTAAFGRNTIWKTASSLWQDTTAKSPLKARPHNNYGNMLYSEGRYEEALQEYLAAARLDPYYAEPRYNTANVYESMGRLSEAIAEYQAAISIYPAYAEAYYNLGLVCVKLERLDEAAQAFALSAKYHPCSAQAHNNLGVILARQGRLDLAASEFSKALVCEPQNDQAQRNLDQVRTAPLK